MYISNISTICNVSVLAKISIQVAVIREGDHRNQRPCGIFIDIYNTYTDNIMYYLQYLHMM